MVLVLDGATAAGLDPDGSALGVERLEQREVMSAIPAPPVYQNPYMTNNNYSEIHLNSYQTDTFSVSGPASFAHQTVQQKLIKPLGGIAGSIAVDTDNNLLVTIRVAPQDTPGGGFMSTHTLLLLDPTTLKVLASKILPSTPPTGVTFSGGGYFYLNNDNQVVNVTTQGEIQIYSIGQGDDGQWEFKPVQQYNVKSSLKGDDDTLNSVLPDSTSRGTSGSLARTAPWVTLIPRPVRCSPPASPPARRFPNRSRPTVKGGSSSSPTVPLLLPGHAEWRHPGALADALRPRDCAGGRSPGRFRSARAPRRPASMISPATSSSPSRTMPTSSCTSTSTIVRRGPSVVQQAVFGNLPGRVIPRTR